MSNIWFTADSHFNHANVIEYSKRPFDSLEHMHEALIAAWNDYIKPGDTVYHLGDFALSWGPKHASVIDDILRRLNGQKWLIKGNHDRKEVIKNPRWHMVKDYHELKIDGRKIVMCHYPMRSWNGMHRGAWMLHGHCHGNLSDIGGKILDVGVDCWGYWPVGYLELLSHMNRRDVIAVDHHAP